VNVRSLVAASTLSPLSVILRQEKIVWAEEAIIDTTLYYEGEIALSQVNLPFNAFFLPRRDRFK
jgi:hypothetical protein